MNPSDPRRQTRRSTMERIRCPRRSGRSGWCRRVRSPRGRRRDHHVRTGLRYHGYHRPGGPRALTPDHCCPRDCSAASNRCRLPERRSARVVVPSNRRPRRRPSSLRRADPDARRHPVVMLRRHVPPTHCQSTTPGGSPNRSDQAKPPHARPPSPRPSPRQLHPAAKTRLEQPPDRHPDGHPSRRPDHRPPDSALHRHAAATRRPRSAFCRGFQTCEGGYGLGLLRSG
jgi:hypothetical protein